MQPQPSLAESNDPRGAAAGAVSWALCVATLDRLPVLLECVRLALLQTRPPAEIVICDAGEDAGGNEAAVRALLPPHERVTLHYLRAERRSSAAQRNQCIRISRADVLFLIDDDSFMYEDFAEVIMGIYEQDTAGAIAAVTVPSCPTPPHAASVAARKQKGLPAARRLRRLGSSAVGRWIWREIFMMEALKYFVPYDSNRALSTNDRVERLGIAGIRPVVCMGGYAMTVRRQVALAEMFDDHLLAYSPGEDLDASYRFSRHGFLVSTDAARLHHYVAASGRLKRRKVAALGLLNAAYFIRRHSDALPQHRRRYFALARRRVLAEFLKDVLSRRWSLPQLAGTLHALRKAPAIFDHGDEGLGEWYETVQREVLEWN